MSVLSLIATARRLNAQAPASAPPRAKAAAPAPARTFSPDEQQARQKVLDSDAWKEARKKFDQWLSVQIAYDPSEVAKTKASFAARIERSSADELTILLHVVQRRLDVLMSPDVVAAREWADEFYTAEGKRDLLKEAGASDPMSMSAKDLTAALAQFASERQSLGAANSAFMQAQASAIAGAKAYEKRQQDAINAAASAPRPAATFGPAYYAPKRSNQPQRYQAPYDPPSYSIGPWGGAWIGF